MVLQSHGDINRLPVQLLALVLQKLDPAAVLQHCAAVAQNWNKAAAVSVRSISIPEGDEEKVTVVTEWLLKHGRDAAVTQFTVSCTWRNPPPLLLFPVQQLSQLQSLNLKRLRVAPVPEVDDTAAPDIANPVLDPVFLSGLTSLELCECQMQLQGLPALTNLQHLHIDLSKVSPAVDASNTAAVAEAIPELLRLTSLQLGGRASQDAALAHVTRLTALQKLKLTDTLCTAASYQQLPQTLTMLGIQRKSALWGHEPVEDAVLLEFGSNSTPGLCLLTALERLSLSGSGSMADKDVVHVEVLSVLTALTRLTIHSSSIRAGPGEASLVVLTTLTRLQHLELHSFSRTHPPATTDAEYAAMTSSPALTHLNLSHVVGPQHAAALFPEQRQLTTLQFLSLGFDWLEDVDRMERIVSCCPKLQQLKLDCCGGDDVGANDPDLWAGGFACLPALTELTKLHLFSLEVSLTPPVIEAVAALTGLKDLRIEPIRTGEIGAMMQLTACKQLTRLYVEPLDNNEERLGICIENQAPEGSPPDVWKQIPAQILTTAADNFESLVAGGVTKREALHSLLRAAAFASKGAAERQTELEDRMQAMEQRMAQLQDNLTAVLAHLQLPGRG